MHKYDPRGRHLFSWGEPGTDPGCFNIPHNIATDSDGHVYVADRENHRVQIFDAQGRYLGQWNNLHRPCGLFADRRNGGLFYVGEQPSHLPVSKSVPNLGARVSVLSIKGDLVGRVSGRFVGEASSSLPTAAPSTHAAPSTLPRCPGPPWGAKTIRPGRSARCRSSRGIQEMGGPEMAPHTPRPPDARSAPAKP